MSSPVNEEKCLTIAGRVYCNTLPRHPSTPAWTCRHSWSQRCMRRRGALVSCFWRYFRIHMGEPILWTISFNCEQSEKQWQAFTRVDIAGYSSPEFQTFHKRLLVWKQTTIFTKSGVWRQSHHKSDAILWPQTWQKNARLSGSAAQAWHCRYRPTKSRSMRGVPS